MVKVKGIGNGRFDISSLYPNPSHRSDISLLMTSQETTKVTLLVTDVAGKILLQQNEMLTKGNNTMKLKVSSLPAGTYFLRAVCSDGCETTVKKFIMQ